MEINVRSTQRHFDIKDISESEMLVLSCFLNWSDEAIAEEIKRKKTEYEHVLSDEEAMKIAIELRDRMHEAWEE